MYLEKIESPKDIKKLGLEQLEALAGEVRETLIKRSVELQRMVDMGSEWQAFTETVK